MVKRKTGPKKRINAGFAAQTAEPVLDRTRTDEESTTNETQSDISNDRPASTIARTGTTIQRTVMTSQSIGRRKAATTSTPVLGTNQVVKANQRNKTNTRNTAKNTATNRNKQKPKNNILKIANQRGVNALKDIRRLQESTKLLIPRAPFLRFIKELIQKRANANLKITENAVEALREASESFLVHLFEDSYLMSLHAKRVTLMPRDISLIVRIKHQDYFNI